MERNLLLKEIGQVLLPTKIANRNHREQEDESGIPLLKNSASLLLSSFAESVKKFHERFKLIFPVKSIPLNIGGGKFSGYRFDAAAKTNAATYQASRGSGRLHAARDIYTRPYEEVVAMYSGKVLDIRYFYMQTYQITIQHDFTINGVHKAIVRYGELDKSSITVKVGQPVDAGDVIGKTGKLLNGNKPVVVKNNIIIYMLHLEVYTGALGDNLKENPLTVKGPQGGKMMRRSDIVDPLLLLHLPFMKKFGVTLGNIGAREMETPENKVLNALQSIEKDYLNAKTRYGKQPIWIEYNGQIVSIYLGKFKDKAQSHLFKSFKGTSGMPGHQNRAEQASKDKGPVPEGAYRMTLENSFLRKARASSETCSTSSNYGVSFLPWEDGKCSFPGWGQWRARLKIIKKKYPKISRDYFYFHDSYKGYSHGCIETETELLYIMAVAKKHGQKQINVYIDYSLNTSTDGGTFIDTPYKPWKYFNLIRSSGTLAAVPDIIKTKSELKAFFSKI